MPRAEAGQAETQAMPMRRIPIEVVGHPLHSLMSNNIPRRELFAADGK